MTERRVEDFVSVHLSQALRDVGLEAPDLLVLEDSEGQERFHVTEEEYQRALDIVFEQEFLAAIANPSATQEACHTIPDGGYTTIVVWADVGTQAVNWGICDDKNHPYERLASLLFDLLKKYMDCPRVDPETPSIRGLCRGCWSYPFDGPFGRYAC